MRRSFDRALLCSASVLALSLAGGLAQARDLTAGIVVAPSAAAVQSAITAAQQAAGSGAQAQASLARAAAALAAAQKAQQDAAAIARAAVSAVQNGLAVGGLMPAGGTAADPLAGIKSGQTKWLNANAPRQSANATGVTVDIEQTQPKSILYWDSFNVGVNTTVNFNQGASDWIALNRVSEASASPSRILGQINARGAVYLINRNGVIFGGGSQVNVHSLIASSLDIGQLGTDLATRDQYFLNTGIANLNSFSLHDDAGGAATALVAGDVKVERGASITANVATDLVALGSSGSVFLFGASVVNSGAITAPTGEIALVAARTVDVVPYGYSVLPSDVLGTDSSGAALKFRGTEFRLSHFATTYYGPDAPLDPLGYPRVNKYLAGTGAVLHDGVIDASRGIVVMNGDTVTVDNPKSAAGQGVSDVAGNLVQGVISVDTSVDRNSMVLLRAATSVSMNGVISSLPYDNGSTLLSAKTSTSSTALGFTPAYVEMSAQATVEMGSSGFIAAPSANVSLRAVDLRTSALGIYQTDSSGTAAQRLFNQGALSNGTGGNIAEPRANSDAPQSVLLAPGAVIDVAGLRNVELPASTNFVSFQPRAEFADMPLQRLGPLYGEAIWIDIRASGTRADGTTWVGTPLADASGYVGNVGRAISQLMTAGGSVNLQTDLTTNNGAGSVRTAGSTINVSGGNISYLPGTVPATRLLGSDGRIYSVTNADPNVSYLGIAGQFTVDHARWGVTETWSTRTQVDVAGYNEGRDAGRVSVTTINPSLLGTIYFGSTAGERQIASGSLPSQGSFVLATPSSVQVGSSSSSNFTTKSDYTTVLSADVLSNYGLSEFAVTANDFVLSAGGALTLAPGGAVNITAGGAIDIAGALTAQGGSIRLTTDRIKISGQFGTSLFKAPTTKGDQTLPADIFVGGLLDASGRFVNDTGLFENLAGPAFTNGGSISITTRQDSIAVAGGYRDATGSILLASGSTLDVSSGGYVGPTGKPRADAAGIWSATAGSIALSLYQGRTWDDVSGPHTPTVGLGPTAGLQMDGVLLAHGFKANGSLKIAGIDTLRVGGTLQPGEASAIRIGGVASAIPLSLLNGGGFGSYTFETIADGWTGATSNFILSAGIAVTPQQRNFDSQASYRAMPTGTALGRAGTPLALLGDESRAPVSLTVRADQILLGTGSVLETDPKAAITLTAVNPQISDVSRNTPAQNVELRGSIIDHGGAVFINALKTHLSASAVVDLSGAFVANSMFGAVTGPTVSGTYLPGGTFTVEAGVLSVVPNKTTFGYSAPSGTNYIIADAGSLLDLSGIAGPVSVREAGGTGTQWLWTDAGTASFDTSRWAWGGTFAASGGRFIDRAGQRAADPRANNGTLILGGGAISLRQDMTEVNTALAQFKSAILPSAITVSANQLAPFDNVFLYAAAVQGGASRVFTNLPGNIYGFAAPVWSAASLSITDGLSWSVTNRLNIAAGSIIGPSGGGTASTITAPYISLTGGGGVIAPGTNALTFNAQTIDIEGASFSGFNSVNFVASGDLRLSTPKVADGIVPSGSTSKVPAESSSFSGRLAATGDLTLSAQRIYPVSAVNFTIETPGTVTFSAVPASNQGIPLSAGGGIAVNAGFIDQGGNLFAPLGQIRLGNLDANVSPILTQSVVLRPGSLTSVTLADTTVPYGATADGTNWYYNASLNPLSQAPTKGIVMAGNRVERMDRSTIDVRGGGDLQANEWIQGKGGSRDALAGADVFALVPSQTDAVAAVDIHFTTSRSFDLGSNVVSGDAIPAVGTRITIDGGGTIPAGTYTLYPAHYATLPGAMRVAYFKDNVGLNLPTGTTFPDGTVLVTGHYTQSTVAARQSSGQAVFAIQPNEVWQQYSEYSFTGANTYFSQQAAKNGTTLRLPVDAGRLSVLALDSIVLNGITRAQPALTETGVSGRGGELDIGAPRLAIIGHDQYVLNSGPAGFVSVDLNQLNGFESVLIGGQRSDTATGTLITPSATAVRVDTRGEVLSAPEVILVAATSGLAQTLPQTLSATGLDAGSGQNATKGVFVEGQVVAAAPTSGTVTIVEGSVIKAAGDVHAGSGRYLYVATPGSGSGATAADVAAALGGTLDATGTIITGADLSKLSYFAKNADGSFVTNADGSIYHHVGTALSTLESYAAQGATAGHGALFAVTNDSTLKISGPADVSRPALTIMFRDSADAKVAGIMSGSLILPDSGRVTIEPNVNITANAMTLQATASSNSVIGNSSDLHLQNLNIAARTIGLGAQSFVGDRSVSLYNQQFADVQALSLKALSGIITLYGDFNPGAVKSLSLDAGAIIRSAQAGSARLSVNGGTLTLVNSGAAVQVANAPVNDPNSVLSMDAGTIVLGGGTQSIVGYGRIAMNATDKVAVAGPGALTLGQGADQVDLAVATPAIIVSGATGNTGGSFALTTLGALSIVNNVSPSGLADRPADRDDTGGSLSITAATISAGSTIQAQAGTIALHATMGDVSLSQRAYLDVAGYRKSLVDVETHLAGGQVVLRSDNGSVATDPLSVIDVAQPESGRGYGGRIEVTALNGNANLAGFLRGAGAPGLGGRFKLDIKGAADLTALADRLSEGGLTGAIDIRTRTGNLSLLENHVLRGHAISLTAQDQTWVDGDVNAQQGQIYIGGRIDASGYGGETSDGAGRAGGQVQIFAANGVTLGANSMINASTSHSDERGGDVTVGIGWGAKSKILLQTGMAIDVSGGTAGGRSGGTVTFRAPRDGNNDVKIAGLSNTRNAGGGFDELPMIDAANVTIRGARAVTVDGFVAIDTRASAAGLDGAALGWTGLIDPAGWYTASGVLATTGSWSEIGGWQISAITNLVGFKAVPLDVTISGAGGTGAKLTGFAMGVNNFQGDNPGFAANTANIPVVFAAPAGGVAATGVASVDASGTMTISITSAGSGYTSAVTSALVGGVAVSAKKGFFGAVVSDLKIVSAQISLPAGGGGYDNLSALGQVNVIGIAGQGNAAFTFSQGSGFTGQTVLVGGTPTFVRDTSNFIPFRSSGVFAFDPATQGATGVAAFTGATQDRTFFATTLPQIVQGTWSYGGGNYGFGNLYGRLAPLVAALGSSVVHVSPGVELVNSAGAITVANAWNLASGAAGNLATATNTATGKTFQYFDPATSNVAFNYRLLTPWGNLESGDLTLRAARDVTLNASISDGFFQFGNYLDTDYQTWVSAYLNALGTDFHAVDQKNGAYYTSYLSTYSTSTIPVAPYKDAGNGISPTARDLASADLFPNTLRVCTTDCSAANIATVNAPSSWSYRLTAGADISSPNPSARVSLSDAQGSNFGNVVIDKHVSYSQPLYSDFAGGTTTATVNLATMLRTGTGGIDVSAARDVILNDTVAPGVIYAAGVNTAKLPDAAYSTQVAGASKTVVAGDADGFFEPRLLAYGNRGTAMGAGVYYGPATAAAFPEAGGDVVVDAQQDIIGYSGGTTKVRQYFQPWLLSDSGYANVTTSSAAGSIKSFGAGVFAPVGAQTASQTAWWIQYSAFQEGILSAGGNVDISAGRDLVDLAVSLPTTGHVSGGLSATSTPVTHLYGSGNMSVYAGRNILGGSFYEGSGHATIVAGGSVAANGSVARYAGSKLTLTDNTLLAVDTGRLALNAGGAVSVAGVVNPAALHAQQPSYVNPYETGSALGLPLYMSTYGPDSGVRVVAQGGDLTIGIAPTAINDSSKGINVPVAFAAAAEYPASFAAIALNGSIVTTGISQIQSSNAQLGILASSVPTPGIVLSASQSGTLDILAANSVDLTFGYPKASTKLYDSTPKPYFTAGAALLDSAFNPYRPNSGFDSPFTGTVLSHQTDLANGVDATARIYAVAGDIVATGGYGQRFTSDSNPGYQRMEINRPAKIFAGRDIVDLNVVIQNIQTSDVSTIEAGRNIYFTGYSNAGGLQIAGPGFLVVQAGGDIGPFLPLAHDNPTEAAVQTGIASVGNATPTAVGNVIAAVTGGSVGLYDTALLGTRDNPRRNTALTAAAGSSRGADIVTLFGTKYGVDYQSLINAYIDPAHAGAVEHNYIPELSAFLDKIGRPAAQQDPASVFAAFENLPAELQRSFAQQVFFAELKAVGVGQQDGTSQFQRGYQVINTLFPATFGYTANALSGGTNGANNPVKTGDLNLLHATMQTRLGGDISIFGPGGNVIAGSLAIEPNTSLKLRDLGILTLGGGAINSFTDGSVLVNSSRVLTTQGGDILMWSSNGDLNAGRGSRTISSAPALQVLFDQNDYPSIDLSGFVTGSGIATLQSSAAADSASVYLLAPRGTIDAGTAGIRVSGNAVFAAPVIANASNIQVQGTSTGIPVVSVPNLGAMTSGSNAAGAASRSADVATASGGGREQASIFIVEVVGYGGGDGTSESGSARQSSDSDQPQ